MSELSPLTESTDGTASLTIETEEKETGEEENEKETETEDNDSLVFATDAEKISDIMSNDPNATRSNTPSKGKRQRVCKSDKWKQQQQQGEMRYHSPITIPYDRSQIYMAMKLYTMHPNGPCILYVYSIRFHETILCSTHISSDRPYFF